jgi:hypothetical protein
VQLMLVVCVVKAIPLEALDRPLGLPEVGAPRISRPSAVEGGIWSAPRTGRFYPPGNISGTHFC